MNLSQWREISSPDQYTGHDCGAFSTGIKPFYLNNYYSEGFPLGNRNRIKNKLSFKSL